jgi:hypothetical protein
MDNSERKRIVIDLMRPGETPDHGRLPWLAFTFTDASRYVLDGNGARLDELRKQYEAAAGRGLPVKYEIATVLLKVAVHAHSQHQ